MSLSRATERGVGGVAVATPRSRHARNTPLGVTFTLDNHSLRTIALYAHACAATTKRTTKRRHDTTITTTTTNVAAKDVLFTRDISPFLDSTVCFSSVKRLPPVTRLLRSVSLVDRPSFQAVGTYRALARETISKGRFVTILSTVGAIRRIRPPPQTGLGIEELQVLSSNCVDIAVHTHNTHSLVFLVDYFVTTHVKI